MINVTLMGDSIVEHMPFEIDREMNRGFNIPMISSKLPYSNIRYYICGISNVGIGTYHNYIWPKINKKESDYFVLLIGINNLLRPDCDYDGKETFEEILEKFELFIQDIITSGKKLLVQLLYPTDKISLNNKIIKFNEKIVEYCKKNNVDYLNLYNMLSTDNQVINPEYTDDGLHPNNKGYNMIIDEIDKKIMLIINNQQRRAIMKDFKREDYIYLRFLEDDEENFKKKGDIVRYKKEWLLNVMKGRRFNTCFKDDSLVWEKNPDADENDVMFDKVYKSITIAKDRIGSVYLWADDYLYLDDWLFSHLDRSGINLVTNLHSKSLPNKTGVNKLVQLKEGCPNVDAYMHMYFNKGETIDFSTIDVASLFYNPSWLKLFSHTEVIVGEEKERLFDEDFGNAIYVEPFEFFDLSLQIYEEHHYFKIKDNIKVKTPQEIEDELDLPYFCTSNFNFVRDENGYITHICTITSSYDNSDRDIEQIVLKIADRIPATEALEIHKKSCEDYVKSQQEERDRFIKEYEAKQQKENAELDAQYQKNKNNPKIFPGVNGAFVHNDNNSSISKQKYSLNQIKEFYRKLKTLNPEIVKHICFYGGTIPYILSNASESRDFGDIDMFVPTKYMEELRTEFSSQESFEMLCDSKPYAEACMLTTRIPKETTEIALTNQSENPFQSTFDAFAKLMTPREYNRDYVDENGIVHNPLTTYKENQLSYYRKVQDFGFKAKLFGINISVFPIYEYENDIMAKSFNVTDKHQFLLGVRVLNDTKLTQLVRPVCIEGAIFYTLPLEYTIVSKRSAVDGKYSYRYEKDKQDIEYILSHKDELGISDDKIKEIMSNYPDYSISIAYEINGNQTTTMGGETYKKLVLTNRNIS